MKHNDLNPSGEDKLSDLFERAEELMQKVGVSSQIEGLTNNPHRGPLKVILSYDFSKEGDDERSLRVFNSPIAQMPLPTRIAVAPLLPVLLNVLRKRRDDTEADALKACSELESALDKFSND